MTDHELSAALNYPARLCVEIGTGLQVLFGKTIPRQQGCSGYLERIAEEFDVLCNVVFLLGVLGETVSLHVAILEAAYEYKQTRNPMGCWLCWLLNKWVQPRHCALMLETDVKPTPASVYWRAGIGFFVAFVLAGLGIWFIYGLSRNIYNIVLGW